MPETEGDILADFDQKLSEFRSKAQTTLAYETVFDVIEVWMQHDMSTALKELNALVEPLVDSAKAPKLSDLWVHLGECHYGLLLKLVSTSKPREDEEYLQDAYEKAFMRHLSSTSDAFLMAFKLAPKHQSLIAIRLANALKLQGKAQEGLNWMVTASSVAEPEDHETLERAIEKFIDEVNGED